jgi:phosphatidylglycerophosphatase C
MTENVGNTATTVAAFDVDGTLTVRDCVVPFMRQVTGARWIVPRLLGRPDHLAPVLARRDRDGLKALASKAAFRGRRHDDLVAAGADFAQGVRQRWMRVDTLKMLDAHLAAGDRVVLVSASFEVYLLPLAELLGVHHVLATRLEVRDGVVTGALDGPNCRGPEKVQRLHRWLRSECGGRENVRVVAYGDSAGDREMLADADEAHWVNDAGKAA